MAELAPHPVGHPLRGGVAGFGTDGIRGRVGTQVSPAQARPGDIVVSPGQSHVGIYLGEGRVLSNSSSRAAFRWESGLNFDGFYGSGQSRIYRLNP